ncbi:F-box protein: endocytic membrane traffic, recycling ReCYcling 1, partial [Serendipita sp. 411]
MRNVLDELERRASARRTTAIAYGHAKTSSGSVDLTSVGRTTGDPQFSNGIRASLSGAQPTIEDDFGDFATADLASDEFDDFIGATPIAASMNDTISRLSTSFSPPSLPPQGIQHGFTPFILVSATRGQYAKAHALLKPLLRYIHPSTPPHTLLPTLLPTPPPPPQPVPNFRPLSPPSLQVQAQLLSLLTRFLSPTFQPTRDWEIRSHALKSCIDVFEATVLKLFEDGDSRHDEKAMREAAWAAWEVHTAWVVPSRKDILGSGLDVGSGLAMSRLRSTTLGKQRLREWEVGKVWIERKEEFYVQGKWDPLANFTESKTLSFDPMDSFMHYVLTSITSAAMTCNVVFPASSCVLLLFTGRFANDVISEYLNSLLTKAKEIDAEILNLKGIPKPKDEDDDPADTEADSAAEQGHDLYLQATAASFVMSWKIVETLMATSEESVERQEAEAIVFKMFDPHMDEYLDEEVEAVKRSFDRICQEWDMKGRGIHSSINPSSPTQTRFLTSHNPQLVKRNVVASFTDVLMLPVTIIPRAVGAVGTVAVGAGSLAVGAAKTTGSLAAGAARSGIAGISMLNPVKWSTRGREA